MLERMYRVSTVHYYARCVSAGSCRRNSSPLIPVTSLAKLHHCKSQTKASLHIMPESTAHLQHLVAHYLANNYPTVLQPFLDAVRISSPDLSNPPQPDLRTLVSDFMSHKLAEEMRSVALEDAEMTLANDGDWRGWRIEDMTKVQMPETVRLAGVRRTLEGISAANLLTVEVVTVPKREFDTATAASAEESVAGNELTER